MNIVAIYEEERYYGTDPAAILNRIKERVAVSEDNWYRRPFIDHLRKSPKDRFKESDIKWFELNPISVNIETKVEIIY